LVYKDLIGVNRMQESMLETLSQQCGCYISSLPAKADTQELIQMVLDLDRETYSLAEWAYCLSYLYREDIAFCSYDEISVFLSRKKKKD
jgi:hypothetical protein